MTDEPVIKYKIGRPRKGEVRPVRIKRKPGRPPHEPTVKDRQMVEVLAGFAVTHARIADVMGVHLSTLLDHYSSELKRGAAAVEAKLIGNLLRIAGGSDGTALKAIMFALQCRFGWSMYAPAPKERDEPLGKKEQLQIEAETAHANTSWSDLLQ